MMATKDDIDGFMTCVPSATQAQAIAYLTDSQSIDEAVDQAFENPNKHQHMEKNTQEKQAASDRYQSDIKTNGDSKVDPSGENSTNSHRESSSMTSEPPQASMNHSSFSPPAYPPPSNGISRQRHRTHANQVIEAANIRARDEQDMQNLLQTVQFQYRIYNSDIEPEHDTDYYCNCGIHQYKAMKMRRVGVQEMWSKAVMYPGEKAYNDVYQNSIFSGNPYTLRVSTPYSRVPTFGGMMQPLSARNHEQCILSTISLNVKLNKEAQASIDAREPPWNHSIWSDDNLQSSVSGMAIGDDKKYPVGKGDSGTPESIAESTASSRNGKSSRFSGLKSILSSKTPEEKAIQKVTKMKSHYEELRNSILKEEQGRWPDSEWRQIVAVYQEKVGMTKKIAELRAHQPIQYLHLLRAGYFEPIPVAWANLNSNPLKFLVDAAAGWRGITPAWRGYEDTAEERLYWVLNHREGSIGLRMKPDIVSEMKMARDRMASAVEPPPVYFDSNDTCHLQHKTDGYSKQVMPLPFQPFDKPEVPTDDTMILLDVSGSMDFDPVRPDYERYLITGYSKSTQPKNKDVAKAIIRRFTDAMANHDHNFSGYQLTTFSSQSHYIGVVNHQNLENMWKKVKLGGGTRVMTGWQKVKELHFQKHSESATHHPVYGWQAGPQTPMLRLLLLLDGEAADMDEFELDLLGLNWVHVTIFLIGVDGCPHHHRHANELSRISQVNHHVSFVDAQGNTPERFVTHELLKRHLGYDISMSEFVEMEQPPAYVS